MNSIMQAPLAQGRVPEYSVLLAEDQPESAQLLQRYLGRQGVTVDWVKNGREALDRFAAHPFPIVITDLAMPEMDGKALIEELNRSATPPIIIVTTADDDILHVIETMRLGVHDYLIKPLGFEDLAGKVERAAEVARLRRMERAVELERQIRLQRQLEWSDWKERMTHRRFDRLDQNLFHNLRTNFSQGYGLGVLLTLLSLIEEQSEAAPGGRLVDAELLDLAFANAAVARRALETFSEIDDILKREFPLQPASVEDLHSLLLAAVANSAPAAALGGHQIEAGAAPGGGERIVARVAPDALRSVVEELLLNAFRFSAPQSSVLALLKKERDALVISIMNQPRAQNARTPGVPPEYESLIFEPFFRMDRTVDERYGALDYGLGLTRAQKIVERHGGTLTLYNVKDHLSAQGPGLRVNAELRLQLIAAGS